jgi:hypothetical protein
MSPIIIGHGIGRQSVCNQVQSDISPINAGLLTVVFESAFKTTGENYTCIQDDTGFNTIVVQLQGSVGNVDVPRECLKVQHGSFCKGMLDINQKALETGWWQELPSMHDGGKSWANHLVQAKVFP